jgi:hypothetical protein
MMVDFNEGNDGSYGGKGNFYFPPFNFEILMIAVILPAEKNILLYYKNN